MITNPLSPKVVFKNYSISKCFSILVDFVVVLIIILYCYLGWNSYSKDCLTTLNNQVHKINLYFDDIMDHNAFFISYFGHYIKDIDSSDLEYMSGLLAPFEYSNKSSNTIAWANKDLKIVVDSQGELAEPIDISDRDYADLSKQNPDKIYIGKVVHSRVINKLIIPIAMGVVDKNHQYIGSVIFGFELSKIGQNLNNLVSKGIEFAFFDQDSDMILSSKDFVLSDKTLNQIKHLDPKIKSGQLTEFNPFNTNDQIPVIYERMDLYPYMVVVEFNRNYFHQIILDRIFITLVEGLIMLVAVGLIFYVIRRIVINPIVSLSFAIDLISKDDDKEILFPNTRIKEINDLIHQIKQIRDYKERLKDSDSSKRAFFANMSHELRTPLNGIIGFCKMLKSGMYGPISDEAKETLDLMFSSAQNLLSLINDLLDFSNMNIGKIELKEKECNIDQEIRLVIQLLSSAIESNNIKIIYHSDSDSKIVFADPRMLKQLLLNIISNAIKFSNFGGKIEINLKVASDQIGISVRDYGIGSKVNVVDTGVMGDGYSRINNRQGSGMGLVLAKKIADLHQAKILIDNKLKKGFEVKFILPKSRIIR